MRITKDKLVEYKNRVTKTVQNNAMEITVFSVAFVGTVAIGLKIIKKAQKATIHAQDISDLRTGTQSVYSFFGSPLQLILDDGIAERYNRFIKEFLDAQFRYAEKHGKRWEPHNSLPMKTSPKDLKAYSIVGKLMNYMIGINGGSMDLPEEQCVSDFLEKLS
jgi:hypothetical protein